MPEKPFNDNEGGTRKAAAGKEIFPGPLHMFFSIIAAVFVLECIVMLALPYIVSGSNRYMEMVADAAVLALLLTPFIWYYVVRPLRSKAIKEAQRAAIIMENASYGVITTDANGVIASFNTTAGKIFGGSRENLPGQEVVHIVDLPDGVFTRGAGVQELQGVPAIHLEEVLCHRMDDGSDFPADVVLNRIQSSEGALYTLTITDISDRRQIESMLRSSEDYFRSFLESSSDCICNISTEGIVLSLNPAGLILNEITDLGEITGKDFAFNITENLEAVREAVGGAALGRKSSVQYSAVSCKDREIWWDTQFSPVLDFDGSVKSILTVSRDISLQKKMEKSLVQAQQMLLSEHNRLTELLNSMEISKKEWENTMDCMGDIVILSDRDGRIKRCNRALLDFTGIKSDKLTGRDWEQLIHEFEFEEVTFYAGSVELLHKPTHRWFEMSSYPLRIDEGNLSDTVITMHETTEVKNITEKLEQAYAEMKATQAQMVQKEKMASIGQLAAGVAHEINNPTGFISSNLGSLGKYMNKLTEFIAFQGEVMESLESAEASEKVKELRKKLKIDYVVEDIEQLIKESLDGADRVKKIVQNLKSFSRVDEAEYQAADINECIESTLNIVWNELKYKAEVVKEYGELPLTKCYPQQLNQVFMNLLVNAAQAIEKQGEIRIKTWDGDGAIHVSVSDTGGGIPQDKLGRIFEPFFTTKPVGKGTGLGLSITYDIIKKHNGIITVASEVGIGTTFMINIPVAEVKKNG